MTELACFAHWVMRSAISIGVASLSGLFFSFPAAQAAPVGPALERSAVLSAKASASVLQGAAQAGQRIVAVGERGIVVLSDDKGKTWRQVAMPVSVGLTAVRFIDAKHGWVVGHGGVVLVTLDGGQTWTKQFDGLAAARRLLDEAQAETSSAGARAEAKRLVADGADKPFLDVFFFDAQRGIIVGAYNLAFETGDGGKTWSPISQRLDNPRGFHLYAVRARGAEVVIVGEQGGVFRSLDHGRTFSKLSLPYKGSFFTVELPGTNEIVVAGMRGNVWRSTDGGVVWTQLAVPTPESITSSMLDARGRVWLGSQAGSVFSQSAGTVLPTSVKLPPLNGLLPIAEGRALALSVAGALPFNLEPSK